MNEPASVLDAQVKALEQLVNSRREARCGELLEDARRRADETVRRAHRDSRARVRTAVEDERKNMQETLAATRAQIATRERQRQQSADKVILGRAWARLGDVLLERWRERNSRSDWVLAVVEAALAHLPGEPWRIEHPKDWDTAEFTQVNERIVLHCDGTPAEFAVRDGLLAGLRIVAGGACLDGTLSGLLADRIRVESELLGALRIDGVDEAAP